MMPETTDRADQAPRRRSVAVTLSSDELTVVSDILRRLDAGTWLTAQPDFQTALVKLNLAKYESYSLVNDDDDRLAEERWARETFPSKPLPAVIEF
jgi:hypothetical protein